MSKLIKSAMLCVLAAFLFTTTAPLSTSANAETLTWLVKSKYPYKVELKFYEKSSSGRVLRYWPRGRTRIYPLRDSSVHEYTLRCNYGAKICYGAWVAGRKSRYWGVGYRGRKGCRNCCYTCNGGETPVRTLR